MIVERFVERLTEGPLHSAGEMLGDELARKRLDVIKEARVAIAKQTFESEFAKGYAAALADIAASYQAAIEEPSNESPS